MTSILMQLSVAMAYFANFASEKGVIKFKWSRESRDQISSQVAYLAEK